jgi:hypothetical protein
VTGNSLDDLKGDIHFTETSYQNNKDNYYFADFSVHSSFDATNERTIAIESPDIIQGKVIGKFEINLLKKMLENSEGSLYANYSRNPIKKGQYLKFSIPELKLVKTPDCVATSIRILMISNSIFHRQK